MIKLCVYVTNNCSACKRVVALLKEYTASESDIQLNVINVRNSNKKVSIVPAVFLNDKLYSLGDINKNDLKEKVYQLSKIDKKK